MEPDSKTEPQDEIGEADASVIAAIVARHCPFCSAAEILRRVMEALRPQPLPDDSRD